ncbi:MAG: hypothetical protein ABW095_10975 [Candidatus Thiodiazotropha sp.]
MDLKSVTRRLAAGLMLVSGASMYAADKPNILVIWGDDIGTWNISHNNRGMMGYETPNIDRIADEGVAFAERQGRLKAEAVSPR